MLSLFLYACHKNQTYYARAATCDVYTSSFSSLMYGEMLATTYTLKLSKPILIIYSK